MRDVPTELKYTKTHEWASRDKEGAITIGITAFAQGQLGDVVFIEMPEVGQQLHQGEVFGVIESVKAASDLYAPLSGEVTAVNVALSANPGLVNAHPYQEGWIIKMQPKDINLWEALMNAPAYEHHLENTGN